MATKIKTALITGAGRGIGLAIVKRFLADGYHVAMLDNNQTALQAARQSLSGNNTTVALHCDVSQSGQVDGAIEEIISQWGHIDVLVNNAGIAEFKTLTDTSFEIWRSIMATNLDGPFICSQACIPHMISAGSGSIVNITSISGLRASTMRSAYGTSKAALAHLTKQMAAELGHRGIRVNAVAPGPIETEMAKKVHTPEIRRDYHANIALNRYGLEEEIAAAVAFLCSADGGYITGQELAVDGGFDSTGIGLNTLRDA